MTSLRQRQPRVRESEYLGWIAQFPCLPCLVLGVYTRGVHVAHLRAGGPEYGKGHTGKAEKPSDKWSLPICPPHHIGDRRKTRITQHHMGEIAFWDAFGVNPFQACIDLYDAYENGESGLTVIAKHAALGAQKRKQNVAHKA